MSRIKKRAIIVAVILLTAIALMVFFNKNKTLNEGLDIFAYPYDVLSGIFSSISRSVGDIFNAAEENRSLKEKLLAAEAENLRCSELSLENRRLAELLNLRQRINNSGVAVRIVGRGYNRMSNTLIIDKGQSHGIFKDMPVITAKGLAGKVLSARKNYSDILLLNDLNFSVAVRLQKSRREAILTGSGRGYCVLKYVPVEEAVQPGDTVVTSGLDGIFQAGIPVGKVTNVQTEGVEFFQYIEVEPFQPPMSIEEAIVINRTIKISEMIESAPSTDAPTSQTQWNK